MLKAGDYAQMAEAANKNARADVKKYIQTTELEILKQRITSNEDNKIRQRELISRFLNESNSQLPFKMSDIIPNLSNVPDFALIKFVSVLLEFADQGLLYVYVGEDHIPIQDFFPSNKLPEAHELEELSYYLKENDITVCSPFVAIEDIPTLNNESKANASESIN